MPSGPHRPACPPSCTMEDRVDRLEEQVDEHAAALADGRVTFEGIRKDLAALTSAVTGLTATMRWAAMLVIAAVIGAILKVVLK